MPNRYGRAMTRDVELGEAGGLAHRTAGSGRPLALLGRGPGLDGSVFFPEVVTLTDIGIRVVAVDRPADGRSPAIEGTGHFPFVEAPGRYGPVVARRLAETAA
jgi:pimeloyl-ACP methyl ester carboxylesterase